MYQVGIDIGSSAAKTAVIKDGEVVKTYLLNTGFSSRKTAEDIYRMLEKDGIHKDNAAYVATGYGRISPATEREPGICSEGMGRSSTSEARIPRGSP